MKASSDGMGDSRAWPAPTGGMDRAATLAEIAAALATTKRTVERLADKGDWDRNEQATGGGRYKKRLYALKDLPTDIQIAVLKARQADFINHSIKEQMEIHDDKLNAANAGRTGANTPKAQPLSVQADVVGGGRLAAIGLSQQNSQSERPQPGVDRHATGTSSVNRVGVDLPTAPKVNGLDTDRQGLDSTTPMDGGVTRRDAGRPLGDHTTGQRDTHLAILTLMRWISTHSTRAEALRTLNADYHAGVLADALVSALGRCKQKASGVSKSEDVLSASTVDNWQKRFKEQGNYCPQVRAQDFTVKAWHITLKERLDNNRQKSCYTQIHEELVKTYPDLGYNAMVNWIRTKYSRMDVLKGRHTGMQLRGRQAYQPRTSAGLRPWDEVHADGWNTHFTAPHPRTGEFVTYELWDFHDVATRYVPPFGIGLTENFEVIAKGIENAIRDQGVMCILQTDSTKIIKANKKFTGDPVKSISDKAGVTIVHPKTVGNAQANGIAENWHAWADKQCRVLATYQAKGQDSLTLRNVKKITAQMVKAADKGELELRDKLKARAEKIGGGLVFGSYGEAVAWIETHLRKKWNNKPHSALPKIRCPRSQKMRHQTPQEALDEHKAHGWEPVMLDGELLADLFLVHVELRVRRGMVMPYGGMLFRADELGAYEGDKVIVAYDSMDYSQVTVKDLKGGFICVAPFLEPTGYRSVTAMEAADEKRAVAQIKNKEKQIVRIEKRAGLDQGNAVGGEVLERIPALPQEKEAPLKRIVLEVDFNRQEAEEPMMTRQETIMALYANKPAGKE